jgi:hypothetical protein
MSALPSSIIFTNEELSNSFFMKLVEYMKENVDTILNLSLLLSCIFIYINMNRVLYIKYRKYEDKGWRIAKWKKILKAIFWVFFIILFFLVVYFDYIDPSRYSLQYTWFSSKRVIKFNLAILLNSLSIYINVKGCGYKSWRTYFSFGSMLTTLLLFALYISDPTYIIVKEWSREIVLTLVAMSSLLWQQYEWLHNVVPNKVTWGIIDKVEEKSNLDNFVKKNIRQQFNDSNNELISQSNMTREESQTSNYNRGSRFINEENTREVSVSTREVRGVQLQLESQGQRQLISESSSQSGINTEEEIGIDSGREVRYRMQVQPQRYRYRQPLRERYLRPQVEHQLDRQLHVEHEEYEGPFVPLYPARPNPLHQLTSNSDQRNPIILEKIKEKMKANDMPHPSKESRYWENDFYGETVNKDVHGDIIRWFIPRYGMRDYKFNQKLKLEPQMVARALRQIDLENPSLEDPAISPIAHLERHSVMPDMDFTMNDKTFSYIYCRMLQKIDIHVQLWEEKEIKELRRLNNKRWKSKWDLMRIQTGEDVLKLVEKTKEIIKKDMNKVMTDKRITKDDLLMWTKIYNIKKTGNVRLTSEIFKFMRDRIAAYERINQTLPEEDQFRFDLIKANYKSRADMFKVRERNLNLLKNPAPEYSEVVKLATLWSFRTEESGKYGISFDLGDVDKNDINSVLLDGGTRASFEIVQRHAGIKMEEDEIFALTQSADFMALMIHINVQKYLNMPKADVVREVLALRGNGTPAGQKVEKYYLMFKEKEVQYQVELKRLQQERNSNLQAFLIKQKSENFSWTPENQAIYHMLHTPIILDREDFYIKKCLEDLQRQKEAEEGIRISKNKGRLNIIHEKVEEEKVVEELKNAEIIEINKDELDIKKEQISEKYNSKTDSNIKQNLKEKQELKENDSYIELKKERVIEESKVNTKSNSSDVLEENEDKEVEKSPEEIKREIVQRRLAMHTYMFNSNNTLLKKPKLLDRTGKNFKSVLGSPVVNKMIEHDNKQIIPSLADQRSVK